MHVIAPAFTAFPALSLLIYCSSKPYAKYELTLHNHAWHAAPTERVSNITEWKFLQI